MATPEPKTVGKIGAYTFALSVGLLMLTQNFTLRFEHSAEGQIVQVSSKDEPPLHLLIPELVLMGLALGVNIDPAAIATLLGRNSHGN